MFCLAKFYLCPTCFIPDHCIHRLVCFVCCCPHRDILSVSYLGTERTVSNGKRRGHDTLDTRHQLLYKQIKKYNNHADHTMHFPRLKMFYHPGMVSKTTAHDSSRIYLYAGSPTEDCLCGHSSYSKAGSVCFRAHR
jgi:hypothetical protein